MKPMLFACLLLWPVLAADPPGFAVWTPAQLKQIAAGMAGPEGGSRTLMQVGKSRAMFFHRESSGTPELHETETDLYVMQSGSGTVIVGGQLAGAKKISEHEVRGTKIEGGTEHKAGPGDIISIPSNTPHQFVLPPNGKASYFLMKIAN